jgi:hypothetical protein
MEISGTMGRGQIDAAGARKLHDAGPVRGRVPAGCLAKVRFRLLGLVAPEAVPTYDSVAPS